MALTHWGWIRFGPDWEKAIQTSVPLKAQPVGVAVQADLPLVVKVRLSGVDVLTPRVQESLAVAANDGPRVDAHAGQQAINRDVGGAHPEHDDADLAQVLVDELERVHEARRHRGGRALLVVVPNRDAEAVAQPVQHPEAFGLGDIFEIDAAERGRHQLDRSDDVVGRLGVEAQGHCIDAAQILEQQGLALHDGQAGFRADVAETEHARAVRDDGDGVGLVGVRVNQLGIIDDRPARGRDARRVPDREILPAADRAFRHHLDLAAIKCVPAQRFGVRTRPLG
jgi:hypothetical protein